jgi:glutamate-1-semialdehyde 2,1-aminomutase
VTILEDYERLHPGSARLYHESSETFPSGVTHDIRYVTPFPIFAERAQGSRKWDVDGLEYVDYVMGHGALFMGHSHPETTRAVVEQASLGTHFGANHRLEIEWARLVRELIPSAEVVRFTSSGTEATLMAIRLARAYTGRDRILKFDNHFHGWHDAVAGTRAPESETLHSAGVPESVSANTIAVPQGDADATKRHLEDGDVAAVILEPTGASWGTEPIAPEFLAFLREVTTKHNTVLIFDEVVTGFRVSPGGTQARYGIVPDLTTMAKILAGGLPGGAVGGQADILAMIEYRDDRGWNAAQRVQHPGTFNANPLSAAAGGAMLRMVREGTHHRRADALNERLIGGLNEAIAKRGVAGCAYGLASYFHIVLGHDVRAPEAGSIEWPASNGPAPRNAPSVTIALKRGMLNHGIDLMGGSGGFVSGVHSEADIGATVAAFDTTLAEMQAESVV